jgi:hypothetical protein
MHPSPGKDEVGGQPDDEDGHAHRERDWVWMHDVATDQTLSVTQVAKDAKR